MAVTVAVIIPPKVAENTQFTQYTSTGLTTLIDKFTATNYSANPASLSINLVKSGGAAADDNLIVKAKTLQAGETYTFPEIVGAALATGDFISTLSSAATAITIRASGRKITA